MSGPLFPYIKIPEIPLGLPKPLDSIKPFGVLVATGVYIGSIIAIRRAKQRHLDIAKMNTFILYVVGIGFVGAHLLDAIFYTPERIAKDPIYLLQFWAGLSSYGGFFGAITGALLYKYLKKESVIGYVDTVCSAFPISWVFGRAGCASVHDHPGRDTGSIFGIQAYNPRVRMPDSFGFIWDKGQVLGRFDLGLIEMLLTVPLATAFVILWSRRPRPYGFYSGWMCVLYAPIRFVLDFLRVAPEASRDADPRYLGLTPAQFACFGLFAIGLFILRLSKNYPAPATWEECDRDFAKFEAEARAAERALEDEAVSDRVAVRRAKSRPAGDAPSKAKRPSEAVDAAASTSASEGGAVRRKKKKKPVKPAADEGDASAKVDAAKPSADE